MSRTQPVRIHPDRQLVDRVLAGDRASFDLFFSELIPKLHRFVAARLRADADVTREIVQSSVCIAIDTLESYRGEAALFSWICGIARYEILAFFKDRKRAGAMRNIELLEESSEVRASLESLTAMVDDPETELERSQVASIVHRTLDYLPSRYSCALEWKYCEGLTVSEVAERLGVGVKAAESVLTRARNAFREAFEQLVSDPRGTALLAAQEGKPR